ncbi:hypothetical protein U2060_15455, partial [Listeria monocytogenes]|uniref:hypothetical protein n=1 Tax=Listeria monocytogenes TaxID=1639 RepID=UPI002FDBB583
AAARDWFSYVAGNLDTLGGLGNSAPTLGQEQLLSSSSNGKMQSMQGEVVKWTTSIIKALAWYVWSDPDCRIRTLDKI